MSQQSMPLERMVAGWMADEAAGAPEALLDQILATTGTIAPRPRIVAALAEPTLRGRAGRVAVGLPNRGLVLAAISGLLLAGLAAAAIGAWLLLNQRPDTAAADWPGFRGAADRTGIALQGPVGNPVQLWQRQVDGAVLEIAVIGDRAYFASDDGKLHAVSRDRGIEQWTVSGGDAPLVGPFAADGRLILSDASGAFHAYRQADGHLEWTSAATYRAPSRAISADGVIYFGTDDGWVVALDAASGAERWRLQPPGATHVDAPALGSGRLVAGTDGAGFVAIDPPTHQVVWAADTHGADTGSAAVIDGIAYIGGSAEPATTATLQAFDAATGRLLWTHPDRAMGIPAVADGVAYSSSVLGEVAAIDLATGATRWSIHLDGDVRSPVVAGGVVYLSTGSSRQVAAIDATTGNELWSLDIGGYANCCVSVSRGALFVGTLAGTVLAIGGDGVALSGHPFPSTSGTPASPSASPSEAPSASPVPEVATVTWTTDIRQMGFAPVSQIAVHPKTGQIWAPESDTGRIAIFDPDGTLVEEWSAADGGAEDFDFTRGNGDGYGTLAFARDGSFFVLDVGHQRVVRFDAKRRFVKAWGGPGTRPKEYIDPVGIAVASDGTVWVLDDQRSVLEHYTADGAVLGSVDPFETTPRNEGANSLAIDTHDNLYMSSARPAQVYVFDPSGRFLRAVGNGEFSEQAGDMAIDAAGRIFIAQGPDRGGRPGVLVLDPSGALIGGFGPTGAGNGQLVFPGGIALDGTGNLYVEDSLRETARLMKLELLPPFVPAP